MWPFSKREEAPAPVTHVATPRTRAYDPDLLKTLGLRKGMWVLVPNAGVGILTGLTPDGVAEVMLVDAEGLNRVTSLLQASALQMAALDDIPAPRRPTPEHGARFGYVKRGQ